MIIQKWIATSGIAVMATIAGCQSQPAKTQSSLTAASAVQCSKCTATWVRSPVESGKPGNRITGYFQHKEMLCPDCRGVVANFFATGKLKHTCPACGGNMTICKKFSLE